MSFETPQTKIARYLAKNLHERLLDPIQRSWPPQRPEVDKAQDRLVDLRGILQSIRAFHIYDRHKQISNDCLEDWLWRFKDFFYTTENVLDDLDFIKFRSPKRQGDGVSEFEEMHFMKEIDKLPEVIETAVGLVSEMEHFNEELKKSKPVCSGLDQQIDTSLGLRTLPYQVRELKGRAAEKKKKILEALFHKDEGESKESPVMIFITGPVGIGKTDLARAVYNSAQVEAEFDVRAWIYMGDDDDWWLTVLQRSESASVDQPSELHISSFMYILNILDKEMLGKKALIVLDGLSVMLDHYDYVRRIFSWCQTRGGRFVARLIVTAQFACTGILDTLSLNVELDGLEEEEYLELFKECALGDRNPNEHPELEDIVGEIAKRFGGNPLAAVMIGRHLKWHQSEDRWRLISRSNLGMIDPTESNIISVLKHSYEKLPGNLMHCYLACALFPKNYPFKVKQLFRIWSAIGCWSRTAKWDSPWEDIGSFFVSSARKDGEFILHAIFHELADYICDGEFFRLEDEIKEEDDVVQIPDKAGHVYVTADNFVKVYRVLQEKTHLRSLVICGVLSSEEHKSSFMGLLEEVLRNLKGLRLLMISVLPTGKLPDAIGGLRHLRYLELPIDTITEESIQELPTWLYDPGFVGLRQLQNLEELRGAIRKLQSGESSHTFKSIDKELSSRESSDPSVLPPLKFSKDDSEVLEEKNKVIERSSHTFKSIDKELSSSESSDPSVLPPLKFSKDDSEVLEEKNKVIERAVRKASRKLSRAVLPPLKLSDSEVLEEKNKVLEGLVFPPRKFSKDDSEVLEEKNKVIERDFS